MVPLANGPVLSGAVNGKAAFVGLIKAVTHEPVAPEPLFLDFKGVDVATASFLRESVFALKNYMRTTNSKYYPVVANVGDSVWDEMSVIAYAKNDVILSCILDDSNIASSPELIGSLDPKQKMTFDLINKLNGADANLLMEQFGESERTKSATAWNNRLAGLATRGIIREFTYGRAKYYRPMLGEAS
jgi:hypothetical protein